MNIEDVIAEAARDLRQSLGSDLGTARSNTSKKVRRRRRSRRLLAGGLALVLATVFAVVARSMQDEPADRQVLAGPGPSTEKANPANSTASSTTSAPTTASTAAPVTETQVARVETFLGDKFELTVPRSPAFDEPTIVQYPSTPVAPGSALDTTLQQGPAEKVIQPLCHNPVGPPVCEPSGLTEFGNGNIYVKWVIRLPDGRISGGSTPELATLSNGEWTIVFHGPDEPQARRVAAQLTISTSATGGPRLSYDDPAMRSKPRQRGDVMFTFQETTDSIPLYVFLSHDCSSLAPIDINDSGRECVDGVGVKISGNPTLAAQLRSVLHINRFT